MRAHKAILTACAERHNCCIRVWHGFHAPLSRSITFPSYISLSHTISLSLSLSGVSGEALDSFDDDHSSWKAGGTAVYLIFGALALGSSLWVIFIASHLSALTRDSAQRPKIIEARQCRAATIAAAATGTTAT